MTLSEFIRDNHADILAEWERFARTLLPATSGMSSKSLRDHAKEILEAIVEDLELPQGKLEQAEKSKGRGEEHRMEAVGTAHAAMRIREGFKLDQLVGEYRALRASVLNLYEKAGCGDMRQVTRFNEALDEALVESTNRYMSLMNRTRDQFLAVLGHDLRNPLGAVLMSASQIAARLGPDDKNSVAALRVVISGRRMQRMINDLLDLTRTRLGAGIPISPEPMDLDDLCRDVLAELQAFHPDRRIEYRSSGDLFGVWDSDRLAQALSNLVGNALQHGTRNTPVEVSATGVSEEVALEIHNEGPVIPLSELGAIFEPMVRHSSAEVEHRPSSLGLGLHIAREIVHAHDGTVSVKSTEGEGTTFTLRLPRVVVPAEVEEPRALVGEGTGERAVEHA